MAQYVEDTLSGTTPGLSVSVKSVSPSPLLGMNIHDLRVASAKGVLFQADEIQVSAALWPLMTGNLAGEVKGQLYGGRLNATLTPLEDGFAGPIKVDASFSEIDLEKMEDLWKSLNEQVTGKLAGQISYIGTHNNWMQGEGPLRLELTGGKTTYYAGFLGLDTLAITRLNVKSSLEDGSLAVNELTLEGREVKMNLAGAIALKKPLKNSRLDLAGTLSPLPELYKAIGANSPVARILKRNMDSGGTPFSITGSLSKRSLTID